MRNLKKVLSLALAMVMLLGMMVIGAGAVDATEYPDYGDVSADKQEAVQVITKLSVIDGTEKGMEPQSTLTRAQAATIVARALLGRTVADALASSTCVFTDVPDWAKGAVQYCADRGIVFGIGNNLFGSNNPVKGTEFATMLLRAVDPEGDYSGSGWENKAIVAANKFGLSDKVAVTSTALTREGAAQMAFNTITSYSPSGATAWSVDGKTFDSFIEAYLYADKLGKVGEISKSAANDSLAATVFNLTTSNKTDAFGRNTKEWAVDGDAIVTVSGTGAALTFTKKITASALDGYTYATGAKMYVDGKDGVDVSADSTVVDASGNGTQVLVYADNKSITKVVVINEYFGTVSSVTAAKGDDKRSITLNNGKKFETEAFEKGDKVIYTMAGNTGKEAIKSVELATLVENVQVTRKTGSSKFIADGTEYEYAAASSATPFKTSNNVIGVNNWVDLYVDSFGYMVSAELNEGERHYAAVIGVGDNNQYGEGSNGCTLLLADGTTVAVNYRMKSTSASLTTPNKVNNGTSINANTGWSADIVKYRVLDSGTYELEVVGQKHDAGFNDPDDIKFVNGKSVFTLSGHATPAKNKTLYTTSNTIFMVATGTTNGRISYNVYTGYNAAPSIDTSKVNRSIAYVTSSSNNSRIEVVYLAYESMAGVSAVDTYVAVPADKTPISDSTGDYYELPAVVDGEVTTVKIDDLTGITAKGVYALSNIVKNSDDIITDFDKASFGVSETGVTAADGQVLGADDQSWAYNDNTLAYYVNSACTTITALDVEDIVSDDNDLVRATLSSDGKTLRDVFVVEVAANSTGDVDKIDVSDVEVTSSDWDAVARDVAGSDAIVVTLKFKSTVDEDDYLTKAVAAVAAEVNTRRGWTYTNERELKAPDYILTFKDNNDVLRYAKFAKNLVEGATVNVVADATTPEEVTAALGNDAVDEIVVNASVTLPSTVTDIDKPVEIAKGATVTLPAATSTISAAITGEGTLEITGNASAAGNQLDNANVKVANNKTLTLAAATKLPKFVDSSEGTVVVGATINAIGSTDAERFDALTAALGGDQVTINASAEATGTVNRDSVKIDLNSNGTLAGFSSTAIKNMSKDPGATTASLMKITLTNLPEGTVMAKKILADGSKPAMAGGLGSGVNITTAGDSLEATLLISDKVDKIEFTITPTSGADPYTITYTVE